MQKFQFGDHVRMKQVPLGKPRTGIITKTVISRCEYEDPVEVWEGVVEVLFEGALPRLKRTDELELVPHPDTARLDWLLANGLTEIFSEGENARETIDNAMKGGSLSCRCPSNFP